MPSLEERGCDDGLLVTVISEPEDGSFPVIDSEDWVSTGSVEAAAPSDDILTMPSALSRFEYESEDTLLDFLQEEKTAMSAKTKISVKIFLIKISSMLEK